MMNELMRLTNRSFPLRVKYHAGWRMLKKITTQKVNLKKKRSSASRKTQVSTTSKESRSSRWSKSFKEKELGDKDRVAELAVDTELLEEKLRIEWSTEDEDKGEIGEARASVYAYSEINLSGLGDDLKK